MDAQIEIVQHIIEDELTQMPSIIHRFQCGSYEYWYQIGRCKAYEEMLETVKSLESQKQ
jgi:hypothetical protein